MCHIEAQDLFPLVPEYRNGCKLQDRRMDVNYGKADCD